MSNLRSSEEPTVRFAKLMAELYYFMAKEMVERLGEEKGKDAVRTAVANFGKSRVEAMHREAAEKGLDTNDTETLTKIRDLPMRWYRQGNRRNEFLAPDFYIKNGFEIYGQIKECPDGFTCYWLRKYL